jgi:hypothetical protein
MEEAAFGMAGPPPLPPPAPAPAGEFEERASLEVERPQNSRTITKIRKDFPESWIWTSLIAEKKE